MKLCLGVVERVYGGKDGQATTTSQVAQILEKKYGIFSGFLEANSEWLTQEITNALAGAAASSIVNGEPVGPPLERVADTLGTRLFAAISDGSIETMTHGPGRVPTRAAKNGVTHRGNATQKGPPRPSFIDTSLLHSSIKGWSEE